MSGRNWGNIAAAIGGLALLVTFLAASGYGYYRFQEATEDRAAADRYQPARDAALPKPRSKQEAQPRAYEPNCQQPQSHEDADLCAQWASVKAVTETNRLTRLALSLAALGFIFAVFGALVGIIGTALIWAAWTETKVANRIARRDYGKARVEARKAAEGSEAALETAARNANAASDQVRISERTAHRQLRPYVHFEQARIIKFATGRRTLSVAIKNFGRTPAKHCEISVTRMMMPYPLPSDTVFVAQQVEATNHTIPPGASYDVIAPFPDGAGSRINDGSACWTVTVTITYKLMDETNAVIQETLTETVLVNYQDQQLGYGHAVLPRDYARKEEA